MKIKHLFDPITSTLTYIVYDETTKDALIIDPVLDYEPTGGKIFKDSFDKLCKEVESLKVNVKMILETHAHADHLSSSQFLKEKFPDAPLAIGQNICLVQKKFATVFGMENSLKQDGSQFDRLFKENEIVKVGSLQFKVLFTPGHTPACSSYLFGKVLFTGDAIFMPDYGTGRCDFPGGSAKDLYHSVHEKIYRLSEDVEIYTCHDYQPGGRELRFKASIKEQKETNIHLQETTSEKEFIEKKEARDKTLPPPRLLLPSIQVNINAGKLPKKDKNGRRFLKIPFFEV
jgi:glyoxylase-like metal-dependent hydrolase (beta-lactamase superfamily II)